MSDADIDTYRRTGRTARQLAALVEQLQPGKTCLYVNPNSAHVSYVLNMLCDLYGCKPVRGRGNTAETPQGAFIKSVTPNNMRVGGPRAVVEFDHCLSEAGFVRQLSGDPCGREEFKPL